MTIMFFKLSNGDDLVATVESQDDDHYIVSNPLKLIVEESKPAYAMIAWFPFCDSNFINIKKRNILGEVKVSEYLQQIYTVNVKAIENMDTQIKNSTQDSSPELLEESQQGKRILH